MCLLIREHLENKQNTLLLGYDESTKTVINFNLENNHSEFERMLTFGCARMPGHYFLGLILSIFFVAESYFPISLLFSSSLPFSLRL